MAQLLLPGDSSLTAGTARGAILTVGGQNGHMTDSVHWDSTEDYLKPQMITVVMAAPEGFKYLPDGKQRTAFLKAMVERWAHQITGVNTSLTNEPVESVVNNTEFFEQTARIARERTRPVVSVYEKRGKVVKTLIMDWMTYLGQDPETGKAGIIRLQSYRDAGSPELTPKMKTMACLFFEADETMTRVIDAVLSVNMFPQGVVNEMQMVKGQALELLQHDLEFSAHSRVGPPVIALAQAYLDDLNLDGFSPQDAPAFMSEIAPELTDEANPVGYSAHVSDIANALG